LAAIIRAASPGVRVVGAGHSFSPLVPTNQTLLSLEHLSGITQVDAAQRQVTCGGGTRLHDLGEPLWKHGLGILNQGDIDAQAIAGAIATGTHGTGPEFGCIATQVVSLRLCLPSGEIVDCSPDKNASLFAAARVACGALGVITRATLQCRPAYHLHERTTTANLEDSLSRIGELAAAHRHLEFFCFPHADQTLLKTLDETAETTPLNTASDQSEDLQFRAAIFLIEQFPAINAWLQQAAMRWYATRERRDRSYRIFPSQRSVHFNEMEYSVPAEAGPACFREVVAALRRARLPLYFPLEFRRVQKDQLWLSPFYERDSVSISVHEVARRPYQPLFQLVEPIFWKYSGRPHWGKLHSLTASQLAPLYPRWHDFQALRREHDPAGKFLTPSLRRTLAE
jgi:FAD-linked oxidoreductase